MTDYGNGQPPPGHPIQQYGTPPYAPPPYGAQQPYPLAPHPYAQPMPPNQAANTYKNAGILMLVSGVKSAIISGVLFISLIWVCVGAFWLLTLAGSIAEIIMGAMILSGTRTRNARVVSILGLVNAVLCLNIIGVALEAIALSQFSKPEVDYYASTGP